MKLHKSTGILRYSRTEAYGYKLIVSVDPGISMFYRWLIPFWKVANPQRYPAHISVVRKETPRNQIAWGKYEGKKIEFKYSPDIQCDERYWWLNVYSKTLENIREELGLPVGSRYTRPPDGHEHVFHVTIANRK